MTKLTQGEQFSWLTCERLDQESALNSDIETPLPPRWLGFGMKPNKEVLIQSNYNRSLPRVQMIADVTIDLDPSVEQFSFAMSLCTELNKEMHHNGAWLVAWTHPPHAAEALRVNPALEWRRLVMLFLDKDGDPQFTIDSVRPWPDIAVSGVHHFVDQAEQGIQMWREQMDALELKENQTIQLAKSGK